MSTLLEATALPSLAAIVLAFFGGLSVASSVLGFVLERCFPSRKIFAVALAKGQYRFELVGNAVFIAVSAVTFTVTLASGVVRLGPESLARAAATFGALLVGFQVYYYFLHRAMHHRWLVRFHRWHHRSHVTTPLSGQSMSFVESCAWMVGYAGIPIAMSYVAPFSLVGWAVYLAFNIVGNVVGHANVELGLSGSRVGALVVNPYVFHALHHARWTGHYGFASALMDRLCRSEWDDWPLLWRKIMDGHPLETLKERGVGQPREQRPRPGRMVR